MVARDGGGFGGPQSLRSGVGVLIGCDGSRLLWRTHQSCRRDQEGGIGPEWVDSSPEGQGDGQRGLVESAHSLPRPAPTGAPMPERLRAAGVRGLLPPLVEGSHRKEGRGRLLDHKPRRRRSRSRRRRRDEGFEKEVRGATSTGAGPRSGYSWRRGAAGGSAAEGKEPLSREAKEKEERKEEEQGYGRGPLPGSSLPEGGQVTLWGDGARSKREGSETGACQSPEVCCQETEKDVEQELRQLGVHLQSHGRGHLRAGDCLHRGDQGQGNSREVSWSPGHGGNLEHEECSPYDIRRGTRRQVCASSGSLVLQEHSLEKGTRSPSERDAKPDDSAGQSPSRETRGCRGHHCAAAKGAGGRGAGHPLGGCSADGGGSVRCGGPGGPPRVGASKEGRLRGVESKVACTSLRSTERRAQREREELQGGQRFLETRRQKGRCEGQERERPGKEMMEAMMEQEEVYTTARGRAGVLDPVTGDLGMGRSPALAPRAAVLPECDPAFLTRGSHKAVTGEVPNFSEGQKTPCPFPPEPPLNWPGGLHDGSFVLPSVSPGADPARCPSSFGGAPEASVSEKRCALNLTGLRVLDLGVVVAQRLLEVFPLRSKSKGRRCPKDIFPLPTSKGLLEHLFPNLDVRSFFWLVCICVSLNSLWGCDAPFEGEVNPVTKRCLNLLCQDVERLQSMTGTLENFCWDEFFRTRSIDYKGDEVKTARSFSWQNIKHALPEEIGRVPLEEVCTLGA